MKYRDHGERAVKVPRWQLETVVELDYQWGLLTVPQTELLLRPVDLEQGKVLGGGSVINIMLMNLGAPAEFEAWKNLGNPGWDYDGIAPYFKKACQGAPWAAYVHPTDTKSRQRHTSHRMRRRSRTSTSPTTRAATASTDLCRLAIAIGTTHRMVSSQPQVPQVCTHTDEESLQPCGKKAWTHWASHEPTTPSATR